MENKFTKYYWAEEDIMFYVHYIDDWAVRQIEVKSNEIIYLTEENPVQNDSMLTDQPLKYADFNEIDFISEEEFNDLWSGSKK